jgi:starch synthase (maltosyl-transferring)
VTQENIGRFPITSVWPQVDGGKYSAKAFVSEVIQFGAVAFREGHDALAVELVLTSPDNSVTRHPMHPGAPGLDQWLIELQLTQQGKYLFQISAFDDE